jgi:aminoglycoside phosphotransferase (APT) family kinase protein
VPELADLLDQPVEPRAEDRLDAGRLAGWLAGALPGGGPVEVRQFPKGHSNLTYLVRRGEREMVLRRAPRGAAIKTAHDMRREFTILSALEGVYPKVPRALAYCDDPSIVGAPFYVMERVRGVILRRDGAGPGVDLSPPLLAALSRNFVDDLVVLHAVDVRRGPLAALGRPEGYVGRQVKGWTERYAAARTDEVADVEAAAAWLSRHQPPQGGAALVHNDYKYDNLVLDPGDLSRIVAVLDWEMATVGDPLMDLGTTLGYWVDADDPPALRALAFGPTMRPGNLDRAGVAARYRERSGRDPGPLLFGYVFGLFKIAVIVQQIYKRYRDGHSADPRFARLGAAVAVLGQQAARALEVGRIHGLG